MIVIPDIHHKIEVAQEILDAHKSEKVVFLGDYMDDFNDTPLVAARTARWLKDQLDDPNKIFLFGNHDLPYAYPHIAGLQCAGFEWDKHEAVKEIMSAQDWRKLKFHHTEEGWLFTHAGRTNRFSYWAENDEFFRALDKGHLHPLLTVGKARGGWARFGGITWCDSDREFVPIPGVHQIFGHTPHLNPVRIDEWNINLDTHLNHYAIVNGASVEIVEA